MLYICSSSFYFAKISQIRGCMFIELTLIFIHLYFTSRTIVLQTIAILSAISVLESLNCLMFTQSTSPFIENCLTMCLVPMTVICITELQICAYLQILRIRMSLLNDILKVFGENNIDKREKKGQIKTQWNLYNGNQSVDHKAIYSNNTADIKTKLGNGKRIINNIKIMVFVSCRVALCIHKNKAITENPLLIKGGIKLPKIISILHVIYQKLGDFGKLINYSYGIQLVVILTIKFTTLTTLLYFCGMLIIK